MEGRKNQNELSRRRFLKASGILAAGAAFAGETVPRVHASENNEIKIGIVGCGNRGRGAVRQALNTPGPTKLVAIGDAFAERAAASATALKNDERSAPKIDVGDNIFGGLDAYKKVMDALPPGGVVILTTPPAFRPLYFTYAVERGLHIFAEKSLAVDTPGCKKMLAANEIAKQKNLKIGVGLNQRHNWRNEETIKEIRDGAIGEIISCWVYRLQNAYPHFHDAKKTPFQNQLAGFNNWTWASGSYMVDWMIHNIDVCCWARGDIWPVFVQGQGGRQVRDFNDQMYDHCAYEYRFADGVKMMVQLRQITKTWLAFRSVIHGTKGCVVFGEGVHEPMIFKGFDTIPEKMIWKAKSKPCDSKQEEHNRLFQAIREDKPWNEIERGVHASFTSVMGRMAVDSGQELSSETCWNSEYDLCPGIENWTMESEAPVKPNERGVYPLAVPGETMQY